MFATMNWTRGEYSISCDPAKVDSDLVAGFLASSYWAKGIPAATVERALKNSLCFVLLHNDSQVGFARVISDRATIAYLGDVFILPDHRGKGLSKWLMECVVGHPELQGLRRWILATRDAHDLYRKFGFTALKDPDAFMELHDANVYGGG